MNLLDAIELRLKPGKYFSLPRRDWEKSDIIIAGATHLDKGGQLEAWARSKGFACAFHQQSDSYTITNQVRLMSQLKAQQELASLDRQAQAIIEQIGNAHSGDVADQLREDLKDLGRRRSEIERLA
jgi:hypothetical protein